MCKILPMIEAPSIEWGNAPGAMPHGKCPRGNDLCIVRWYLPCVFHCHVFSFMSHIFILSIIIHFLIKIKTMCITNDHNVGILNIPKTSHKQQVGGVTLKVQDCIHLAIFGEKCIINWMVRKDIILLLCCHVASLFPGALLSLIYLLSSILSSPSQLFFLPPSPSLLDLFQAVA